MQIERKQAAKKIESNIWFKHSIEYTRNVEAFFVGLSFLRGNTTSVTRWGGGGGPKKYNKGCELIG